MDVLTETEAPALPPEAPLDMPVQSLRDSPPHVPHLPSAPRGMAARRVFVIGGAAALSCVAAWQMYRVLDVGGPTPLEFIILILFVMLFAWIALAFTSAIGGAISLLGGGRRLDISRSGDLPLLSTRTALLMPVYNESPARVMAGMQAIHDSLRDTGRLDVFDFFILSDSTNPEHWIAEEAAFLALRARTDGHNRIFYRRRPRNTQRKPGNVADWVRRFGAAYPQMLVLDADSVMNGETIVRLAGAMERHPDVGLIQTLPVIVNGRTLFARMQQFAGRVYGPLIAHGIAWWHGAEGNYWGHNALIRTAAFAAQAGLPVLTGRKPFGGAILSHDFIEAALMRRGGWAIHMVPALEGSYEESPASLTDIALRDRRWCQGNLQHAAILPARGLHWVSRMHLLMGIGSYITAPLWMLFMLTGFMISLQARFIRPEYFPAGRSLFPRWPQEDPVRAMWMFIGTMAILLAPKLLGYIVLLCDRDARRGCGGAVRAFLGVVFETVVAGLIAPVAMLIQSAGVMAILAGRDSGWRPQRREDGRVTLADAAHAYWQHTVFGVLLALIAFAVSPFLLLWMLPVVLGLMLAIPLAALTGDPRLGRALGRIGLLRTPEEHAPPLVLRRAAELQRTVREETGEVVRRLAADPRLLAAHRSMLPPARRPRVDPIDPTLLTARVAVEEAGRLSEALAALDARQKAAALADASTLERLIALARAETTPA